MVLFWFSYSCFTPHMQKARSGYKEDREGYRSQASVSSGSTVQILVSHIEEIIWESSTSFSKQLVNCLSNFPSQHICYLALSSPPSPSSLSNAGSQHMLWRHQKSQCLVIFLPPREKDVSLAPHSLYTLMCQWSLTCPPEWAFNSQDCTWGLHHTPNLKLL